MKVTVIRSNRKTVAIQVNSDLSVTVRAPYSASEKDIEEILKKKEAWISRHIEKIKKTKERFEAEPTEKLTRVFRFHIFPPIFHNDQEFPHCHGSAADIHFPFHHMVSRLHPVDTACRL